MANTLYTAPDVVKLATALLTQDLVLAQTINRDYEANYGGGRGTTVNVRIPGVLKARRRNLTEGAGGQLTAFQIDTLTESTFPVELSTNPYSKVALSQKEMTFDLENFGEQVLAPQMDALVEDIEEQVAEAMLALPETDAVGEDIGDYLASDPVATFRAFRKALRDNGVPISGLRAACGTQVWSDLAAAKVFDNSTLATNPSVPGSQNISGFESFETNRLPESAIVFYHRDSFTLAVRSPENPAVDTVFSASLSANGFALQHIQDYDSTIGQHTTLVQTFTGVEYLPFHKIDRSGATASVVEVPSAYRLDTSANL